MPERPRRVGGGTAEGTGVERQTRPARGGNAEAEASMLMKEVVRRENLIVLGLVSFLDEHRRLACTA